MVKLRLARKGNRKRPFYRMVVAEDSHRRDGRFIEIVGTYDPLRQPATIEVESDAVLKWLSQGAQPTDTVRRILAKSGVWAHWRAVQEGKAELGDMTGRQSGTVEREKEERPSKKSVARIAEEKAKKEEEAKAAAEAAAAEAEKAEEPAEEVPAESTDDAAPEAAAESDEKAGEKKEE